MHELPHKLLNNLRFRTLENKELFEKSQNWVEAEPSLQSPFQK